MALNDVYGPIFGVNRAEAATPNMAKELATDRIALAKADHERSGDGRTNRRYGYVTKPAA